ncbi:MAG: sensor histidine kinase N-terminal domain-containing protein [Neisseriaceae bacterium]|nr:sensor histidine kinase N-terminal domain-containing protein [Neisseriaceae bacterium]
MMFRQKPAPATQAPKKRAYSLRLRLLLSIIGMSVFFWLVSLSIMVYVAWDETNDVFDDALKESASLLLHATRHEFEFHPRPQRQEEHQPDTDDLHYQVVQQGEVVSRTKEAPLSPFVTDFPKRKGFRDMTLNGHEWRVFVIKAKDADLEVQVAQSLNKRLDILEELAENLIVPALLLLLLLVVVSALAIYYLLRPLTQMAQLLAQQSPQDLTALPMRRSSNEVNAITDALNTLLARLQATLLNERRFTADAAHELRTPLAALSMQAQLLKRQHPELAEPLQALRQDIDRSTHLVSHLLLLARLDPLNQQGEEKLHPEQLSVAALLHEQTRVFQTELAGKNMQLVVALPLESPLQVYANRELIGIVLRNLISNALSYCPAGSTITLAASETASQTHIVVQDNGPGVSDEEVSRLTQRFYRILGTETSGSGLGLSIVQRIMELHHARLQIESGRHYAGLKFNLIFNKKASA